MTEQATKARRLRALHVPGDPLVCVNVWDVASTRVVDGCGAGALATASWSIAAAHGYADGEQIPRDEMLDAVQRIASATQLPVSADLERGFGDDVEETVSLAVAAGAAGCNLEDSLPGALRPVNEAAARVAAARAGGGPDFVINARADTKDVADVVLRGRAYLDAGADCVFAVLLTDPEAIREAVGELEGRVSVLARPGRATISDLAALGVARVSVGPGSMGAAYHALRELASSLLSGGAPPETMKFRPGA